MNIEGTSLVAPVVGISMVASPSSSGTASEGFTAALVAQVGLISAAKAEAVPLPALGQAVPASSVVAGVSVATVGMKNITGLLLGNNLSSKNDTGHQAALVAVTDTLKYIATGETLRHVNNMPSLTVPTTLQTISPTKSLEELTAQTTQVQPSANGTVPTLPAISPLKILEEVTAQTTQVRPSANGTIPKLPAISPTKSLEEVTAQTTQVQPSANGTVPTLPAISPLKILEEVTAQTTQVRPSANGTIPKLPAISPTKSLEEVTAQTTQVQPSANGTITTLKSPKEVIASAIFDIAQQSINDDAGKIVPAQINAQQDNKAFGKKPVENSNQPAKAEEGIGVSGLLAGIINSVIIPVEQGAIVADLVPADVIKQEKLLSFINPFPSNEQKNQLPKIGDNAQNSVAPFGQSIQDKQSLKLNYFENVGQVEITGPVAHIEGAKILPPVVGDAIPMNKSAVELKADVLAITKPLAHPEWNRDLGERIVWMANRAIPTAEIKLNPPQLGPISVRIDVADDQATVVFTAQHVSTREAIEASMPRLREMMSAQQLNLVEVSIFQGSSSDQSRSPSQNFAQTAQDRGQGAAIDEVEQEIDSGQAIVSKGLLSIYA